MTDTDDAAAWKALAELYHRQLTGLVLALVLRAGTPAATEVVFRTFRRQHLQAFLPGLAKLGLTDLPPAVACARYHVLSNALGGVRVEWIPETDAKSWVRYLPPRWIFDGTAVCGIPTEVARAMLWGWHGHNGVSLGNDRLGFVCTSQTTDGQPGLVGYYIEEDHALDPEDRVRFRPDERPPGPAAELPLPAWDPVRLAKVDRNYATTYIGTILPAMAEVLGPADAAAIGSIAARQVAMQYHPTILGLLGEADPVATGTTGDAGAFAARMARLLRGHGIEAAASEDGSGVWEVVSARPPMLAAATSPAVFEAWNGLWTGFAAMEGVEVWSTARRDLGDPADTWRIRPTNLA